MLINLLVLVLSGLITYTNCLVSRPIILLHGLESNSDNMIEMAEWIKKTFERTVINAELGNGNAYSSNTPIMQQVDAFYNDVILKHNTIILKDGFDFIGISQGGLIGRGYVQKYNTNKCCKIYNLITLVTPHGGVYYKDFGQIINFYNPLFQSKLSVAGYWRDPTQIFIYKLYSSFLAEMNGEKSGYNTPKIYKENIISLKNFVMVFSQNDEIIKPASSGIFYTYDHNNNIIPLENNPIYTHDWIGLKTLNDTNRLHSHQTTCTHIEHRMPICFPQLKPILSLYL